MIIVCVCFSLSFFLLFFFFFFFPFVTKLTFYQIHCCEKKFFFYNEKVLINPHSVIIVISLHLNMLSSFPYITDFRCSKNLFFNYAKLLVDTNRNNIPLPISIPLKFNQIVYDFIEYN